MLLLMIGLGGGAGAYARYRLAGWVYERTGGAFPWGTLAVNLLGSFALGLVLPWLAADASLTGLRAVVNVGFIGAFTTFSTFAFEAVALVEGRDRAGAALYVVASLGLGLLSLAAGFGIGRIVL